MRDDFLARDWADQHGAMSDGIDKAIKGLRDGYARLAAHRFDAPWRRIPAARHHG